MAEWMLGAALVPAGRLSAAVAGTDWVRRETELGIVTAPSGGGYRQHDRAA
jgi:hypothetical protein